MNAPLLLDEIGPRRRASEMGLMVIGTVGVLGLAADRGLIADLRAVHDAIRASDFRIDDAILNASLARHEGRDG